MIPRDTLDTDVTPYRKRKRKMFGVFGHVQREEKWRGKDQTGKERGRKGGGAWERVEGERERKKKLKRREGHGKRAGQIEKGKETKTEK